MKVNSLTGSILDRIANAEPNLNRRAQINGLNFAL